MYRPSPYAGLQTLFDEGKELSDQERLQFAYGPLLAWYRTNKRDLPWRNDKDAYHIWISEIMLQQTRVEAVKPYYFRFMEHFPTVQALADAPDELLMKCWEGLGYYSRARNLKKAAQLVASEYGGKLPESREELLKLPGIGSYTAGAIASIAYEAAAPAVDGNVLRVLSRVTGSRDDILKQSTKRKMEELISTVIRAGEAGDFTQAMIETGAIVCVPNGEPLCDKCPFYTVCEARAKGLIDEIPVKTPKKKRKIEEKTVLLLQYKDKIAIRKRKEEGLLASLYEFPNISGRLNEDQLMELMGAMEIIETIPEAKHIFSHIEWHMCGYYIKIPHVPVKELPEGKDLLFVEIDQLKDQYPIPSAFSAYKNFLNKKWSQVK